MILLPMEIIYKILSYRETHPMAKMIQKHYDFHKKISDDLRDCHDTDYDLIDKNRLRRISMLSRKYIKPAFLVDYTPYYWVIKHPDYNPANYKQRLCTSKMKEQIIRVSPLYF